MINNAALDVAIGLILMYLMLSLLCTVINEFIATGLDLRAKSLAAALTQLLDDPNVRSGFYTQGLIAGTRRILASGIRYSSPADPAVEPQPAPAQQPASHPSYLSADTFAQALIGAVTGNPPPGQPMTLANIQTAIEALPDSGIKDTLLSSIVVANNDVDAFRKNVARLFDDSMERLSGAYKRNLKVISIVIGLLVAIGFNADTIGVAGALWQDPDLRARVVAEAKDVDKGNDNAACRVKGQDTTKPQSNLENLQNSVTTTENCLRPFPIGWMSENRAKFTGWNIIGWIITGLALSLGAPFWFDLLGKFMNIRGSGPKPTRTDGK